MTDLTIHSSVCDWAAQLPAAIAVLEARGIDYCCHGDVPLAAACQAVGVMPERLLDEFQQAAKAGRVEDRDWSSAPLGALCDDIERTHHAFLREQLPRLAGLIDKVIAAHAERHPELHAVRSTFRELRHELEPHLLKEERLLFPAIRALEDGPSPPAFPFGSLRNPMGVMEDEHERAGDALSRLRKLTGGYQTPPNACPTYSALFDGLRELESDLHRHIHKENNLLFPRAAKLEASARERPAHG